MSMKVDDQRFDGSLGDKRVVVFLDSGGDPDIVQNYLIAHYLAGQGDENWQEQEKESWEAICKQYEIIEFRTEMFHLVENYRLAERIESGGSSISKEDARMMGELSCDEIMRKIEEFCIEEDLDPPKTFNESELDAWRWNAIKIFSSRNAG